MLLIRKGELRPTKGNRLAVCLLRVHEARSDREARGVRLWQGEEAQNKKSPAWPQLPAAQSQAGFTTPSVSWTATSPIHMDTDQGA